MTAPWPDFLARQTLAHDPVLANAPLLLAPLNSRGVLEVAGPDAAKFLQGQLTCHTGEVTTTASAPGAHCTPQGRMLANFRLLQWQPLCYRLGVPRDALPRLQTSLGKYIVFSKARITDVSAEVVTLGLAGTEARAQLRALASEAPEARHGVTPCLGGHAVQLDDDGLRFELWLPTEQALGVWEQLVAAGATAAEENLWTLLDIRAGLGSVLADTVETFIPQMLNLQVVGGIHFKKGCYTGQEIVARMQYLGKLKRHMYRASVAQGTPPPPGTRLFVAGSEQSVGDVVQAAASGPGQCELLAVIADSALAQPVHLGGQDGPAIEMLSLPYTWG